MTDATPTAPDPRPDLARAAGQLAGVIAAADELPPAAQERPTPCAEYDVRDLLTHLVDGAQRWAELGETGVEGDGEPEAVPAGQWTAAYQKAHQRFTEAWAEDRKLDVPVTVPWGTMPGRIVLAGYLMELAAHTWDLARALGRGTDGLDQELAESALRAAQQALPAERRGEGVPFDPVREAPEGTDGYGRLAAWLGRDAGWTP